MNFPQRWAMMSDAVMPTMSSRVVGAPVIRSHAASKRRNDTLNLCMSYYLG